MTQLTKTQALALETLRQIGGRVHLAAAWHLPCGKGVSRDFDENHPWARALRKRVSARTMDALADRGYVERIEVPAGTVDYEHFGPSRVASIEYRIA